VFDGCPSPVFMLSVARLTLKELLLDDFGLPDASSSELGRRHVIACEWYPVYVGCWAPCLRIEPTAHSLFILLSLSCLPRTTSGFLCCIPKPKELLLPTSVKSSPNNPLGLLGGHESDTVVPRLERNLMSRWPTALFGLLDAEG
jgi:hypothetical protein